jgi:hypothetical protein
MAVARVVLSMGEETLRDYKMQVVFGAGHRDIKKPPLASKASLLCLSVSSGDRFRIHKKTI